MFEQLYTAGTFRSTELVCILLSLCLSVLVLRCFIGMTNTFTFILPKHCCVQLK